MNRTAFGVAIADKLDHHNLLTSATRSQKEAAAAAVHDELHEWAVEHLPMGASANETERCLRNGLRHVRTKFGNMSDAECQQSFGFPILLVLGLIPTLVSWIKMLVEWWNGE